MPRYHCLNTEVQIYTWDPSKHDTLVLDSSHPAKATPATDSYSASSSRSGIISGASIAHEPTPQFDPAWPFKVNRLKEEFFRGWEGLDFLGRDIPFFLIQVGGGDASSAEIPTDTEALSLLRYKVPVESSQALLGSQFPSISSTPAKGVSYSDPTANGGDVYQNCCSDVSLLSNVSSLSVLPPIAFLPPQTNASHAKEPGLETGDQVLGK
jgi:hypothetical protein